MDPPLNQVRQQWRSWAVRSVGPSAFVVLVAWCAAVGGLLWARLDRVENAVRALETVGAIRERVQQAGEVWNATIPENQAQGSMDRFDHREDMQALWTRAEREADSEDREELRRTRVEVDTVLDRARQVILLRLEAHLARTDHRLTEAASLEAHAELARDDLLERQSHSLLRLSNLEQPARRQLSASLGSAGLCGLLLASTGLMVAFLLWRFWLTRRHRDKHMKGARLVEEMLEAYSRRLESMNAQLEQVSLLKTQFLANTSHELLTPLNGIMGSLELLRDDDGSLGSERNEMLDRAYRSSERLHALIQDLLDLCRLEEGDLALRCRTLEFGPLLERVLRRNRSAIRNRGLTLLVTPPSSGWPRVQADPARCEQVLQHLLSNAVKFTEQGSIRITGRIEEEGTPQVRLEVSDTGVGIPGEKLPQVFDLFSQADGSDTRRFGGTGLGLTLCRHLIQGMDGRIGIESDGPGRGTRVWFTLPVEAAPGQAEDAGAPPEQAAA